MLSRDELEQLAKTGEGANTAFKSQSKDPGVTAPGASTYVPPNNYGTTGGNKTMPDGVSPLPPNLSYPEANSAFMQWLFGSQMPNGQLQGLPSYPGQLNVPLSSTILPQVWDSFDKNKGIDWMKQMIENGGIQNPAGSFMDNIFNLGGIGGAPTERMNNLAQTGLLPGLMGQELQNQIMYGRTSGPGGDFMSNMANSGIASIGSGGPLQAMAYGQPSAASQFLAQYLQAPQYAPAPVPYQTARVA